MQAQKASLSAPQAVAAVGHIKCRKHQNPQIPDAGAHLGKTLTQMQEKCEDHFLYF